MFFRRVVGQEPALLGLLLALADRGEAGPRVVILGRFFLGRILLVGGSVGIDGEIAETEGVRFLFILLARGGPRIVAGLIGRGIVLILGALVGSTEAPFVTTRGPTLAPAAKASKARRPGVRFVVIGVEIQVQLRRTVIKTDVLESILTVRRRIGRGGCVGGRL